MSAIAASSVKCATLADGTLRITIEIEPKDALAAFTLFRAPGTPMAIAALKDGYAQPSSEPIEQMPPAPVNQAAAALKGGELSKWAAMRCNEQTFFEFIAPVYDRIMGGSGRGTGDVSPEGDFGGSRADYCRHCILAMCRIDSRAELDHDKGAAELLHTLIRKPYAAYMAKRCSEAA